MRRRDVIAAGREDHKRVMDQLHIGIAVFANAQGPLLKVITDEQVLNNRYYLLAAEEIESSPPAFEFKEALALAVNIGEQ